MLSRSGVDRAAAQALLQHRVGERFESWARLALPAGHRAAAHHRVLMRELEAVRAGQTDRLMVLMPPGSAKSTYASVLFPPWWFARHPGSNLIAASHTASLAATFGGRVRGLITEYGRCLGLELSTPNARHDFCLAQGGTYYAVGVHGGVTGRRADLVLIDDPVRSHEDADSPLLREQVWDWYRSDLLTRLKPGGRIVLIMTRWHLDDLGGRLLAADDGWRCLKLPALAGPDDPLGRAQGAALWPSWEDEAALQRKRAVMGERAWAALFQQEPRRAGDTLFAVSRIAVLDRVAPLQTVRAWDLAATMDDGTCNPDWTVGLKLGREATGRFVTLDVIRLRSSPHDVMNAVLRAAAADGPATAISLPQDPGQAGKAQAQYMIAQLAGYRVSATRETGSKLTRAGPVASQVEAGNLAVMRGEWNTAFLDELADFPHGRKDDQVDALSRGFLALSASGAGARHLTAHHLAR